MHMNGCTCPYTHIYIHTYIHIDTHTCIHIPIYTHAYIQRQHFLCFLEALILNTI